MPAINKCPLCGKTDCVEFVKFTIEGIEYSGYKCNTYHSMLYSFNDNTEKELSEFKSVFKKLSKIDR